MYRNKFRCCTLLLIDDDNHSKIFISKKNKCYIEYGNNRSLQVNILNEFKDIRNFYEIDVKDISDNYYNIVKCNIKKYCTILLIDDIHTGRVDISEKNMYYIGHVGDIGDLDDDDNDGDNCYESVVYHNKFLNNFEPLVSVRYIIVNLINNDERKYNITLLVDDFRIFICENDVCYIDGNGILKNCFIYYSTINYHIVISIHSMYT